MNILNKISNKIYSKVILNILYKENYRGHYSNLANSVSLHQIQKKMNVIADVTFKTEREILFKNISLNGEFFQFVKTFGTPKFKTGTKYSDLNHHVYVFKNKFCGYNARVIIHTLEDTILTCAYHFEINECKKLEKIKTVLQTKYQLENVDSNNFLILDNNEHKIFFNYQFDAEITYINSNPDLQKIINELFEKEHHLKEINSLMKLKKLELSF